MAKPEDMGHRDTPGGEVREPEGAVGSSGPVSLDETVRRADPDRWLASRFIGDRTLRADVIALYAFNHELARVAETVREPLMGEIRLTWWREAVDEIFEKRTLRRHPVVEALAAAVRRHNLARAPLDAMVEARFADLEPKGLGDDAALDAYIDGTAGALIALTLAATSGIEAHGLRPIARAWALAGLLRLRRAGVARLPERWTDAGACAAVLEVLTEARTAVAALPVDGFPCIAYAALAKSYAAGRSPSELEKRVRLTAAVLTGRI